MGICAICHMGVCIVVGRRIWRIVRPYDHHNDIAVGIDDLSLGQLQSRGTQSKPGCRVGKDTHEIWKLLRCFPRSLRCDVFPGHCSLFCCISLEPSGINPCAQPSCATEASGSFPGIFTLRATKQLNQMKSWDRVKVFTYAIYW